MAENLIHAVHNESIMWNTTTNASDEEKELQCGPIPNVMANQLNIGGTLCESSIIPFLVPRRKVWLTNTARVPCGSAANIGEGKTLTQSEFCNWQNSVRGQDALKMNI